LFEVVTVVVGQQFPELCPLWEGSSEFAKSEELSGFQNVPKIHFGSENILADQGSLRNIDLKCPYYSIA
jgi:hypothetical protein